MLQCSRHARRRSCTRTSAPSQHVRCSWQANAAAVHPGFNFANFFQPQGVDRLLQQASKAPPLPAARAAAEAAQQQWALAGRQAHPQQAAAQQPSRAGCDVVQPPAAAPAASLSSSSVAVSFSPTASPPARQMLVLEIGSPAALAAWPSTAACSSTGGAAEAGAAPQRAPAQGAQAEVHAAVQPTGGAPKEEAEPQLPRLLTVQLLPWGGAAKARVEAAGANPYLELANLK